MSSHADDTEVTFAEMVRQSAEQTSLVHLYAAEDDL